MLNRVAILGYSGHSYVVTDVAISMGMKVTHYCDIRPVNFNPYQLEYLGFEGDCNFRGWDNDYQFILGIGDNEIRHRTAMKVLSYKKELVNVIHASASYSQYSKMGIGNFISRQVTINAFSKVGDFCILNTACVVEHECLIGNAVHIAPGAVLSGNVTIGDFSFIGANSVIKNGVKVGTNVTIGAGAVIIKDVPDNSTVVGNPGRKL